MPAASGRRPLSALLVSGGFALLALSACGTTVPVAEQAQAGRALGGGLGTTADQGGVDGFGGSSPAGPGGAVATTTGTSGAGTTGSFRPSGSPSIVAGGSTGGSQGGTATAVGAGAVEIGFTYTANGDAFLKALGVNAHIADGRIYVDALLKDLNKRGGIAGHPVRPVYYNIDLTRSDPYSVWMSEMCAMWTEDHKVIAGIVLANSDFSPVAKCLAKRGAIFGNTSGYVRTQGDYRVYPNWIESQMLSADRLAQAYVDVPQKAGYFGTKPKIGLLAYDYPQSVQAADRLSALLVQRGYDAPVRETLHLGQSTGELSGTIASAQSAALKFSTLGVDHVMSVAYPGAVSFFAIYAESQRYHPRYAMTTYEGLTAVQDTVPVAQLKDAVAVGWMPPADVDTSHQPPLSTTSKDCYRIYTAAGVAKADQPGGLGYCDFVKMLESGAGRLTASTFSGPALRPGIEGLGRSYLAPGGFGTTFRPDRHDGVDHVRLMRFDGGCSCFTYAGPDQPVP